VQVFVNIAESANVNLKLWKSLVTSSFHELQDQFLLRYESGTIDDNEFSALQEEFMSKKLDFSYEEHNRVLLEEMNNNAKFSARYNLKRLSPYKILT